MTLPAALPYFYWQDNLRGGWFSITSDSDPRQRLSKTAPRAHKVRLLPENMRGLPHGVLSLIYPPPGVDYVGVRRGAGS